MPQNGSSRVNEQEEPEQPGCWNPAGLELAVNTQGLGSQEVAM